MRASIPAALVAGTAGVFAGCGNEAADAPVALPSSGTAYRALNDSERLAVAAGCRDRAAARADGVAADELGRVHAHALREQLDTAFRLISEQDRPVAELCVERLPFVTPGLRLSFVGAKQSGDEFTYLTSSEKPLTIRGAVSPTPDEPPLSSGARTRDQGLTGPGSAPTEASRCRRCACASWPTTRSSSPSTRRQAPFERRTSARSASIVWPAHRHPARR